MNPFSFVLFVSVLTNSAFAFLQQEFCNRNSLFHYSKFSDRSESKKSRRDAAYVDRLKDFEDESQRDIDALSLKIEAIQQTLDALSAPKVIKNDPSQMTDDELNNALLNLEAFIHNRDDNQNMIE